MAQSPDTRKDVGCALLTRLATDASWALCLLTGITLFLVVMPVAAQTSNPDQVSEVNRNFQLLREDEDWTFLRNPDLRQDFWDPIKYIPIGGTHEDWYLTVAGVAREVWEQIGNDNWGQQPYTNGYLNERYMLSFDIHYGKYVSTFVELKSGLNSFRRGGPRPIDEKKLDFQAGYLEVGTAGGKNWIKVLAGRQELEYGSGRLIDVREGPNVRMSFDGFRIKSKVGAWSIDGFAMRPDLDNPGFFDNAPNHAVGFWGVYGTVPLGRAISADMYYLGLDRATATFQRGTARELRHSLGVRLDRPAPVAKAGWDFNDEALWQFGSFGAANITAWAVASDHGYSLPNLRFKPRFSVKADIASGDNPRTNRLGTFNALFPDGNYFGVLLAVGPGPVNFMDIHPRVQTQFPRGVSVSTDWIFQWRENVLDGVYSIPGTLIRAAGTSSARFVGQRPGTEIKWQINPHLSFQGDYGVFFPGQFLKDTQPGRNLSYWAAWADYKF